MTTPMFYSARCISLRNRPSTEIDLGKLVSVDGGEYAGHVAKSRSAGMIGNQR